MIDDFLSVWIFLFNANPKLEIAALAALSLSFPVYIIIIAFGSGIGSGVSGIISNLYGRDEPDMVKEYFIQSVLLGLAISIVAAGILYAFMNPLFRIFHAEGIFLREAGAYTGVIVLGGFHIIPALGIPGIALATVLVQVGGVIFLSSCAHKLGTLQGIDKQSFIPKNREIKKIIAQAAPATLKMGLLIFIVMMVPVMIFARFLLTIFTTDSEVIRIGVLYLRIQFVTFYSYILLHQCGAILQGIKRPSMILWTGLYRQIPAPLIFFNLFAIFLGFGITGIWWGITTVNWSAALIILAYTVRIMKVQRSAVPIIRT